MAVVDTAPAGTPSPRPSVLRRACGRAVGSPRLKAARILWQSSPGLALAVLGFVLAEGILPNLALIAIGRAAGYIPDAVAHGLSSPSGHRLLAALAFGGTCYGLSLLRGPVEDLLSAASSARVTAAMQRRLAAAVSTPAGIEHLEDPAVLDRLASATGELLTAAPADAPMTLAGMLGDRLAGLVACGVLATFRWWVGLMFLVGWVAMRPPLRRLLAERALVVRTATSGLRQAWHFLGCAWRPYAAKEVRVFGLGDWLLDRHRDGWETGMAPAMAKMRRLQRRVVLMGLAVAAMYLVGCGELGWAAYHHEIGLRTMAIMLPMLATSAQIGGISTADVTLELMLSAIPDLDRLTADLAGAEASPGGRDTGPRPADAVAAPDTASLAARATAASAHRIPLLQHTLAFEQLRYRYPNSDHDVLDGLDLELPAGTSLAVVGVNGAGKTTLVTLLARLREPTGGRITVDGVPLTDLPADRWQGQVAVVYQDFTRYPFSARQNVALASLGHPVDQVALERAAEQAGLSSVLAQLPRGWDTVLSAQYEGGVDLSGGQWQRVALARALYSVQLGASVLVLDEPTSQLDVRAEAAFYDRFLELTAGVTTVVISHRFSTVRRAGRIAVLDGGRVTELGTHDELVQAGGIYAEMFELQAARFAQAGAPEGQARAPEDQAGAPEGHTGAPA